MKFPSIIEYLEQKGLLVSGTAQEIEAAKKERRRLYLKYKKQEYRKSHKTVSLSFTNTDMKRLDTAAKLHHMKTHEYLHACIHAARTQAYIVPNTEKIHQVELLLRRVATHTNQIAKLANQMSLPPTNALLELREHLRYFEETFTALYREPQNLQAYIEEELRKNPAFINVLLYIIQQHIKTLSSVHQDA